MAFEMVAKDVIVRNGRRVFVSAGDLPGSIAATAVFSQKLVTVNPGQLASVDVTVTIPPNPSGRAMVAYFQGTTRIPNGPVAIAEPDGICFTIQSFAVTLVSGRTIDRWKLYTEATGIPASEENLCAMVDESDRTPCAIARSVREMIEAHRLRFP